MLYIEDIKNPGKKGQKNFYFCHGSPIKTKGPRGDGKFLNC
jgi:hypothetical protein